ncbi:MAG: ABC transporter, partial [Marinilabiliales bacterium]
FEWWEYIKRPLPKFAEMEDLQKRMQTAEDIAFMSSTSSDVEYLDNKISRTGVAGISEDYNKVFVFDIAQGRYFSSSEFNNGVPVCIIGAAVAKNLFFQTDPIGRSVKLLNRKVQVVGVIKEEGTNNFGQSNDELVLVPYSFLAKIIDTENDFADSFMAIRGKEGIPNEEMIYEITGIMRTLRHLKPSAKDDFSINEPSMLTEGLSGVFSVLKIVGWIIGGFSLLVGGFGIANIMFVSVKERTSIIGIQKSLGAKNSFILFQFLIEAVFLSIFGGLLGLFLVWLASLAATYMADFALSLTTGNIILGISVSAFIGLVAGMIPAYSASRLDPVEAIRQN